jgi:hypothetical protein
MVQFLSRKDALAAGLAYIQKDNTTVLAVDSTTKLAVGQNRKSVRLSTKATYNTGLFIADFWSAPHGCGTWPAYWSLGTTKSWPNAGEIDLLESVHESQHNQVTLHTGPDCKWDPDTTPVLKTNGKKFLNPAGKVKAFTGQVLGKSCASSNGDNTGCGVISSDTTSYGQHFNRQAGGVVAHRIDGNGITVWQFGRSEIPADITAGTPNPDNWPTPVAHFSSSSCDISKNFQEHQLILDITLCGQWAGDAYGSSGCPGTCAEAVADPANFKFAQFKVNYISVFQ